MYPVFNAALEEYIGESRHAYENLLGSFISNPRDGTSVSILKVKLIRASFAWLCMRYTVHVKDSRSLSSCKSLFESQKLYDTDIATVFYLLGQEGVKWENPVVNSNTSAGEIKRIRRAEMLEELVTVNYLELWKKSLYEKFDTHFQISEYFIRNLFGELGDIEKMKSNGFFKNL